MRSEFASCAPHGSWTATTQTHERVQSRSLADAEAYRAKWHEEDKEGFNEERLPWSDRPFADLVAGVS